jgi:hypothetical protein
VQGVEPRRYRIEPQASSRASIEINDDRRSLDPDDDLIEIVIAFSDVSSRIGVTLSVNEIAQLRDVLDEIARRND